MSRATTRSVIAGVLILIVAGAAFLLWRQKSHGAVEFRFTSIRRGTIEDLVTSTGSLKALEVVDVGTQVSGQVSAIYVDFNDRVTRDQLIARIDPTILEQEVRSAEATVERAHAELDRAERTLARADSLYLHKAATAVELEDARYALRLAQATRASSDIALERARRNLRYSEIRAPISGVIVARNVEVGQTVAATFSAPTLFVIARDLSKLEIVASVDESDIGRIEKGQVARFTVQAYEDEFIGRVRQVRLAARTEANVVSYNVVVDVENPDRHLLPGMTTTIDFVVSRAPDVLMVANGALRFHPDEELANSYTLLDTIFIVPPGAPENVNEPATSGTGTLWLLKPDKSLQPVQVITGLSNGQFTAIGATSDAITEGSRVIASIVSKPTAAAARNPFQQQGQFGGRGGPGGPPMGRGGM